MYFKMHNELQMQKWNINEKNYKIKTLIDHKANCVDTLTDKNHTYCVKGCCDIIHTYQALVL